MAKKNEGICWLCHHNVLIEYCYDIRGRKRFIRKLKPKDEQPTRLKYFQLVKGKLPKAVVEAYATYEKAQEAKWAAVEAAEVAARAWTAYSEARAALDRAIEANMPAIIALHKKEQPDCPWNGKTLFPEEEEAEE